MFGTWMSQNIIYFFKWPLQTFLNLYKNFNFSNYCKARQYKRRDLVSGDFVNQGRQNRSSKRGCKILFKALLKTHKISNYCWDIK